MNKAYNPVKWLNHETPINEVNLNRMGDALNTVDDRVCNHDRVLSGFSTSVNQALEASKTAVSASASAVESAEKAEEALKNAEAVVGVGIATKDKAGLVKADDVLIESDGTLKFIEKTTSTTMPNSHKGRLLIEEIGGVSEQDSTTGAQLLDVSNRVGEGSTEITVSNNVIKLTATSSGTYRQSGYVVTDVPYVVGDYFTVSVTDISSTNSTGNPYIVCRYLDENNAVIGKFNDNNSVDSNNNVRTFCIEEVEGCAKIALILIVNRIGTASVGDTATITDLMVNTGTTALPWEPYTGGQASPSPDYPQEIKNVVVSGVKTHGVQFFDETIMVADDSQGNTVTWEDGKLHFKNTTGTYFRIKRTIILPKGKYYFRKYVSGSIVAYIGFDIGSGTDYHSTEFVLEETTAVVVNMTSNNQTTAGEYYANILITTLEDAEYAPYTESTITLSEPIELCGIGDAQDKIVQKDGVWGIEKSIAVDNLREYAWRTEWSTAYYFEGTFLVYTLALNEKAKYYTDAVGYIVCTHFGEVQRQYILRNADTGMAVGAGSAFNLAFRMPTSIASTQAEWKQYLADNDVKFYYLLANPTFAPLPTADQIALNSLATYDGATYLEWDCYLEPTFSGEYGTSKVGGYTLEGLLTGRNAELLQQSNADRITALETALINNV